MKRIFRNFDIGDLRSGQFCDLSIISQWEKNVRLFCTKTIQNTLKHRVTGRIDFLSRNIVTGDPSSSRQGHFRSWPWRPYDLMVSPINTCIVFTQSWSYLYSRCYILDKLCACFTIWLRIYWVYVACWCFESINNKQTINNKQSSFQYQTVLRPLFHLINKWRIVDLFLEQMK